MIQWNPSYIRAFWPLGNIVYPGTAVDPWADPEVQRCFCNELYNCVRCTAEKNSKNSTTGRMPLLCIGWLTIWRWPSYTFSSSTRHLQWFNHSRRILLLFKIFDVTIYFANAHAANLRGNETMLLQLKLTLNVGTVVCWESRSSCWLRVAEQLLIESWWEGTGEKFWWFAILSLLL